MFLEFQKITTSQPSRRSPIIVDSDALLTLDSDVFQDENNVSYIATRVEVIGYPKYAFYTMTSLDDIASFLGAIDVTNCFIAGNHCAGGNTVEVVQPTASYPMIKAKAVFNNTLTETENYLFNPNHLLYAESTIFNDGVSRSQETGLMIVLRDTGPTRVLTKLDYSVLFSILQPVQVV